MSNGFLFVITSIVDFVLLAITVWLGLYILTRSPKRRISWLASGILWTLGGSALSSLFYLHAPPERGVLPWWWGWGVTIVVAFWFHLSVVLSTRRLSRRWGWVVILVYFLALNMIAMQTYTSLVFKRIALGLPLTHDALQTGALYPLFGLFLILILVFSLLQLWGVKRAIRIALLQREILILLLASSIFILGFGFTFLSTRYGLHTPIWPGDLCQGLGGILIGYGILRINTLQEGKVIGRDFLFSFIATGLVVAAYLLAAFFSRITLGIPFVAFIFLILLAIITHSLVDWGRERLENFFYRSRAHPELRKELRTFARTTTSDHEIQGRLGTLLRSLCQKLRVKRGLIALREEDRFEVVVSWHGDELEHYLDTQSLSTDEIEVLQLKEDVPEISQASAIIPLLAGGEQVGVIILGYRTPPRMYGEDDFAILEYFADTVAGVTYGIQMQEEKLGQIQSLMEEIHERESYLQRRMRDVLVADELHPFLNLKEETEAVSAVEDALRHLNDYTYLADHPLVNLNVVKDYLEVSGTTIITHLDRAKALHRLLVACIEKLKPLSPMPSPPSKEWHPYVILHQCYVEGRLNRDVMGTLYIGEGTFHRARRSAVRSITRVMAEMEDNSVENTWSS